MTRLKSIYPIPYTRLYYNTVYQSLDRKAWNSPVRLLFKEAAKAVWIRGPTSCLWWQLTLAAYGGAQGQHKAIPILPSQGLSHPLTICYSLRENDSVFVFLQYSVNCLWSLFMMAVVDLDPWHLMEASKLKPSWNLTEGLFHVFAKKQVEHTQIWPLLIRKEKQSARHWRQPFAANASQLLQNPRYCTAIMNSQCSAGTHVCQLTHFEELVITQPTLRNKKR